MDRGGLVADWRPAFVGGPGGLLRDSPRTRQPLDWTCDLCGNHNFAKHDACHQASCGGARPPHRRVRAVARVIPGGNKYPSPPITSVSVQGVLIQGLVLQGQLLDALFIWSRLVPIPSLQILF
eukprot:gene18001-biopygen32851